MKKDTTKKTMNIPDEADGIVDDQKEFEAMMAENEAKLAEEIARAKEDEEYNNYFRFEDLGMTMAPVKVSITIITSSFKRLRRRKPILTKNS